MCLISVSLIRIHLAGNGNIGQVVFLTYYCLTALPLIIIFLKEKNLRNLCMLLCIAISVASTKRTGTIALILGILVMLVLDAHIQGSLREKWKKYMYLFIAICIGSGAVLYLENRSGLEIFDRFSKIKYRWRKRSRYYLGDYSSSVQDVKYKGKNFWTWFPKCLLSP